MSVTQMEFQGESAVDDKSKASQQGKRNPPSRNTSRFWFERFLAVIQRQNPSIIDATFLSQIAPNNEGKLLAQLKFLHVIDEQGKPTQLLPMLNMIGEEQKKGFQEITRASYQDLLSEVKIEKAVPDDLVNFFIRRYAFTRDKAINAAKFFLYLSDKASIQVSQELTGFLGEKPSQNQTGVSQTRPRVVHQMQKDVRMTPLSLPVRKNGRVGQSRDQPPIVATVNIRLDKDTPKEYWDRVFALLGEQGAEVSVNSEIKSEENEDQES